MGSRIFAGAAGALLAAVTLTTTPALANSANGCQVIIINKTPTELCPGDVYNSRTGLEKANPKQVLPRGVPRPLSFPVHVETMVTADQLEFPVMVRAAGDTSKEAVANIKARREEMRKSLEAEGFTVADMELQNLNIRGRNRNGEFKQRGRATFMVSVGGFEDTDAALKKARELAGKQARKIRFSLSSQGRDKARKQVEAKAVASVTDKASARAALFDLKLSEGASLDLRIPNSFSGPKPQFRINGLGTVVFETQRK